MTEPRPPAHREPSVDPRIRAFCARQGMDVFHSVCHRHEIWKKDPYDVTAIHVEARDVFERLLDAATRPPGLPYGRILLILGESGCGKTHLMRAFRNYVHERQLGYCGYLQMTAQTDNYGRYALSNLIESLDRPYSEPEMSTSGLICLSNAVIEGSGAFTAFDLQVLHEVEEFPYDKLGELISIFVDRILGDARFAHLDIDVLRALVYLQRSDIAVRQRVLQYLRCEELPEYDWQVLGGSLSRHKTHEPQRMIEQLGRVMSAMHGQQASLVLLVDQLEDIYNLDDAKVHFRRAMDAIRQIADNVPSSVIVLACLTDFYAALKEHLAGPVIDRLEHDPAPIHLTTQRSEDEVKAIISRRLLNLYDSQNVPFHEDEPVFPLQVKQVRQLANMRTRSVLNWCRQFREGCILAGRLIAVDEQPADVARRQYSAGGDELEIVALEQRWNEFRNAFSAKVPGGDTELAELLGWTVQQSAEEIATGHRFETAAEGRFLDVKVNARMGGVEQLVVGVCNKGAQGGGLQRQVAEVERRAGERIPVIVRSTDFPSSPRAKANQHLGQLIAKKRGRKVLVQDSDWRAMQSFREFYQAQHAHPRFAAWRQAERPLTQLRALQEMLRFEELEAENQQCDSPPSTAHRDVFSSPNNRHARAPAVSRQSAATDPPAGPEPTESQSGGLCLGTERGVSSRPVQVDPQSLTKHAAFLGATGSGKTTVALNLIEQLLLRGVPAVMVDRKGDLCRYASSQWWAEAAADSDRRQEKKQLGQQIDVRLYTPGHADGRPLPITVVPQNLAELSSHERFQTIGYCAVGLAAMMGYKDGLSHQSKLAILRKAIELLAETGSGHLTLEQLIDLIAEEDPALVNAVGRLDTKHFRGLVQDLETLRLNRSELLSGDVSPLSADELFGTGNARVPGKTRLSIISTKFLADRPTVEFWVSRLLVEIGRWTSRMPSETLQAVVMFDEADLYLPAQRKPATKEPMENLLKRARSAGLGIFLASQNPGDFDYKLRENIGTWLVGRIKEKNSIAKMQPMLTDCRADIAGKLSGQKPGDFYLLQATQPVALRAYRSLMETVQLPEDEILRLAQRAG